MRRLFFIILIPLIYSAVSGQSISTQQNEPTIRLFATVGTRPFKLRSSDITFAYVAESPSRDNMTADVNLREATYSASLKLGGQYELPEKRLFAKALLDIHLGQTSGASIDFGGGYILENGNIRFRPQLMLSYGTSGVKLGDLFQNDVYIEVNRTRFYSNSVAVRLRSKHFVLSPQAELAYAVDDNLEILAGIGYNVALSKGSPYLHFSGEDQDNESLSATESVFAPNVFLTYEGEQLRNHLIGLNFVFFQFGVSYRFQASTPSSSK